MSPASPRPGLPKAGQLWGWPVAPRDPTKAPPQPGLASLLPGPDPKSSRGSDNGSVNWLVAGRGGGAVGGVHPALFMSDLELGSSESHSIVFSDEEQVQGLGVGMRAAVQLRAVLHTVRSGPKS